MRHITREATPWVVLATAWTAGLALTAGWTLRVAWGLAHDRCGQAHRGWR